VVGALITGNAFDVHEIEAREQIEMGDVRGNEVRPLEEVAHYPAVFGGLVFVGHFLGQHRGHAMFDRADAANPLRDVLGVQGVASAQDGLKPAEHLAGDESAGHFLAIDLHLDTKVALDARNRIQLQCF
jgi:hypothetical protein